MRRDVARAARRRRRQERERGRTTMARKVLFITTDQQRYDTLGCNGGTLGRTPVLDGIAASGIRYERAVPQSVVCMPSRSTMLTGQYPTTHGVWMNGVPLPEDAPSVAAELHRAGYAHRAHRQAALRAVPRPVRSLHREHRRRAPARRPRRPAGPTAPSGPHRGFDHLEFATHGAMGPLHYARWLATSHPEAIGMYFSPLDGNFNVERDRRRRHRRAAGEGQRDPARLVPHRLGGRPDDRVARLARRRRRLVLLDELPRPAPPVGPAAVARSAAIDWRDVPLPAGYPADRAQREAILDAKPRHWRLWYDGELVSNYEAPKDWVPATLTEDQIREVNARNAVEVELIDEAIGRVLAADRRPAAGPTTSTSCSPPTTASCRATSACSSRARTTSTR